jgi:hypothetical protein
MKQGKYRALIVLNAALIGVLLIVSLPVGAKAQLQQGASTRGRGDYTMVAGRAPGSGEDVVWIVDAVNQETMALRWDISRQDLQFIGFATFPAMTTVPATTPQTPRSR